MVSTTPIDARECVSSDSYKNSCGYSAHAAPASAVNAHVWCFITNYVKNVMSNKNKRYEFTNNFELKSRSLSREMAQLLLRHSAHENTNRNPLRQ